VIFDMDGVLIDSEQHWDRARRAVVAEYGGTYHAGVAADVMGMSPPEWSRYLHDRVGIPLAPAQIERAIVHQLRTDYEQHRPFYPGAIEAVRAIAAHWPVGIASSSGRDLIDLVVSLAGLTEVLRVTVSGAEVGRGKPAPDVYLRAARLLGADPRACAAIEDSGNGIRAGKNAGMRVVAVPNAEFPPPPDAVALADVVLARVGELTPAVVERLFAVSSAG
jgi:HAD superfamily hydrolase (TIGR01509 family)